MQVSDLPPTWTSDAKSNQEGRNNRGKRKSTQDATTAAKSSHEPNNNTTAINAEPTYVINRMS